VEANRIQTLLDAGERNRLSSVDEESWGRLSKQLFPKLSEAQRQLLVEGTVAAAKTAEAREELQQEGFKPGTFEYAVQLKKLGGGEAVSAGESPKTNFNVGAYPRSFFTFGVRSVSPFKVDPTNHALIRSSSDTRGYVEYVFNNHWAFTTSEDDVWADDRVKWFGPKPKNATKIAKSLNHGDWFLNRFDTEFRTGFTFAGDKATAATITGSGDFYVDGAVGFRWYQIASKDLRMSFGPEAAGGMSTDFSNIQVHPHGLLGAAWHIGLNPFLGAVPERRAAITFRAGYGFVDAPELTLVSVPASGGAKKDVLGVVVENDRIKYHSMAGGPAVEADMVYPLSKSSFLVAGGRIFKTANFDQWSFHIGYVLSLDKVAAAFGAAVD
jgi:hypothetical protein